MNNGRRPRKLTEAEKTRFEEGGNGKPKSQLQQLYELSTVIDGIERGSAGQSAKFRAAIIEALQDFDARLRGANL